jgi:hypothetical protein
LKTQATRDDPAARRVWKVHLFKGLFGRRLNRQAILELFRLIDWMMDLPKELDDGVWQEVYQFEEDQRMRYLMYPERIGREQGLKEGRREGLLEGIELGLKLRFGKDGLQLMPEVRQLTDLRKVRAFHKAIEMASLEDLQRRLAKDGRRKP